MCGSPARLSRTFWLLFTLCFLSKLPANHFNAVFTRAKFLFDTVLLCPRRRCLFSLSFLDSEPVHIVMVIIPIEHPIDPSLHALSRPTGCPSDVQEHQGCRASPRPHPRAALQARDSASRFRLEFTLRFEYTLTGAP